MKSKAISNDNLVRQVREKRAKAIKQCSEKCAEEILESLPKNWRAKIDKDQLVQLIRVQFSDLNS